MRGKIYLFWFFFSAGAINYEFVEGSFSVVIGWHFYSKKFELTRVEKDVRYVVRYVYYWESKLNGWMSQ